MSLVSGGGGGALLTGHAWYDGGNVLIANGDVGSLTWNTLEGGTELLTRSAPGLPTVLAAGVYVVAVQVSSAAMTAGGSYEATLTLDVAGDFASVTETSAAASAAVPSPALSLCAAYYLDAGDSIRVRVGNLDGVAARNFALTSGIVQRLA